MLKNFIKGYRFVVLTSDLYVLTAMTVSAALAARRTLVKLLLALASAYSIAFAPREREVAFKKSPLLVTKVIQLGEHAKSFISRADLP